MNVLPASQERRIVTVLAVDVVGSTRHIAASDPEDAQDFLDRCFEHIRTTVARAGGLLIDYEGDGGLAVFGWPEPSEDHADRACVAAWELQEAPTRSLLGPDGRRAQFRVGVHTGLVSLRQVSRGGAPRANMSGATVHVAAALQKQAEPGGVLLSADTLRVCRSELSAQPVAATSDAAKLTIDCFALMGLPQRATASALSKRYNRPMIGRVSELHETSRAAAANNNTTFVLGVVGEPGIGKSRFASALLAQDDMKRDCTLAFFGDEQKRATSFAAARALILEAAREQHPRAADPLAEALSTANLTERVLAITETFFATPRRTGRRKPTNLTQTQIARALVDTFRAIAPKAQIALVIEDAHLLDPESWRFLRLLSQAEIARPLLMVVTGRPEARVDIQSFATLTIELPPLEARDMMRLARQLSDDSLSADVLSSAVERADGIPFVLEELVDAIAHRPADAVDTLPRSVASAVHARINRLSPESKATIQTLSLLGEEVDTDLAMSVAQHEPGRFAQQISELQRSSLIHPQLGRSIRFRHQIIMHACAETIPRMAQKRIHASALAALGSIGAGGNFERLAHHAVGAGDDRLALSYLWQGAIEARNNAAAGSLSLTLDRALQLIERVGPDAEEQYVDFVLLAFASMLQLGEFSKMRAVLPQTMTLAREQDRPDKVCGAMSQLAMMHWFEGRYEQGLDIAEAATTIARQLGSLPLIFSNQLMVANNLHGLGRMQHAISTLQNLCDLLVGELETARLGAAAIPSAMSHAFMSWFLLDTGRYDDAVKHGEQALEIAVREQDPYSEVLARHSLGRSLIFADRNADAVECLMAALQQSDTNGYDAIKPHAIGSLSIALAKAGRAGEALPMVRGCLDAGLHLRTGRLEVYHLYAGYAEALFESGDRAGGLTTITQAIDIARAVSNPCLLADGLALRAAFRAHLKGEAADEDVAEMQTICAQCGIVARKVDLRSRD